MKIKLDKESADALREFAKVMPLAIDNIRQSTETVIRVYQSVAENIGPYEEEFCNMIRLIKSAQEEASDAIQELPAMLNETADAIIRYLTEKGTNMGK